MAKVERVAYFMANLEDKPGALLAVMKALKSKNINLGGLWGFGTHEGKATLFVVPKNPDKLRKAWKASGSLAEEGMGFFIKGADRAGALNKSLESLAQAGVNIHAIDAISVGGRFGSFIWVAPGDIDRAARVLGAK